MAGKSSNKNHHQEDEAISQNSPLRAATLADETADVVIDGSQGEGGGQIVRTSLALASIFNKSVKVVKIRYNRPKPGLQAQHLEGVQLVSKIVGANVKGARFGSQIFVLDKNMEEGPNTDVTLPIASTVNTAGAISLILQASLPILVRNYFKNAVPETDASPLVFLRGGTCVPFAPTTDYTSLVLAPNLKHFGIHFSLEVCNHGYYPRGGGLAKLKFYKPNDIETPKDTSDLLSDETNETQEKYLRPWTITERGPIVSMKAIVTISGNEVGIEDLGKAGRYSIAANYRRCLRKSTETFKLTEADISICHATSEYDPKIEGKGNKVYLCVTLYAKTAHETYLGRSSIWSLSDLRKIRNEFKGIRRVMPARGDNDLSSSFWSEAVSLATSTVVEGFCNDIQTGAAVDEYMADQLLIWMAMAKGRSVITVPQLSMHVQSVIDVLQSFGVHTLVEKETDSRFRIECEGKGVPLL